MSIFCANLSCFDSRDVARDVGRGPSSIVMSKKLGFSSIDDIYVSLCIFLICCCLFVLKKCNIPANLSYSDRFFLADKTIFQNRIKNTFHICYFPEVMVCFFLCVHQILVKRCNTEYDIILFNYDSPQIIQFAQYSICCIFHIDLFLLFLEV